MQLRITFRSEIYLSGDSLANIRDQWEELPLFSADALDHDAEFVELCSVERVDDDSYDELTTKFQNATDEALMYEQEWEDTYFEEGN